MTPDDFVARVIELYREGACERVRPRRSDRDLARAWYGDGVALDLIETAIRLAHARRAARPQDPPPLQPIRSLHYFVPILEELRVRPPAADYLDYLRSRSPAAPASQATGAPPKKAVSR